MAVKPDYSLFNMIGRAVNPRRGCMGFYSFSWRGHTGFASVSFLPLLHQGNYLYYVIHNQTAGVQNLVEVYAEIFSIKLALCMKPGN